MIKQNNAKIILHIDMDAFFCSVACLIIPSLRGKVFAIGRENSYRGVISSASYEARALGIHSAMSQKEAFDLVPNLRIVSLDYSYYIHYHNEFLKIMKQYSNVIEVASIDEAFLDITELTKLRHPLVIAKEIQARILSEVGLSCSIGIAPTLFLAKMASDLKKPLGISVLRKKDVEQILYPLSVKEIYGVGKKTFPNLIQQGIQTIGDFMKEENQHKVISLVGENTYRYVVSHIRGQSTNIVDPNRYSDSKSISTSQTFDRVITSETEVFYELRKMTRGIVQKLQKENYYAKNVTITMRNTDFKTITRSKNLDDFENDFIVIYDMVADLVENHYHQEPLRLLGVGLSKLVKEKDLPKEYNLFTYESFIDKENKINEIIEEYQAKYGKNALFKNKKK